MTSPRHPSRRTVVRSVAWTTPVIAAGVSAPVYAASVQPASCSLAQATWSADGPLFIDGSQGTPTGTYGHYSTGWTPLQSEASQGYITVNWWNGDGNPAQEDGFMSMDDHNNSAAGTTDPRTVTTTFTAQATPGAVYDLALTVRTAAFYLAPQFLSVTVDGPGIHDTIAQISVGDRSGATIPNDLSDYTDVGAGTQTYTYSAAPTSTGTITVTCAFTLAYKSNVDNADIWVATPDVTNCGS